MSMSIHESLTVERVMEAAERSMFGTDNPGFCVRCGEEQEGCEQDMRRGQCESCGEMAVYGAEELMLGLA